MRSFINAVQEVSLSLNRIILFRSFVDALLVFLAVYFLLISLGFNGLFALLPALFYIGYDLRKSLQGSRVVDVEKKYPELDMKLRTAAEYARVEGNPFVEDLHKEVETDLKHVSLSPFLNMSRTSLKIVSIIAICFIIIFFAQHEIYFDVVDAFDRIPDSFKPKFGKGTGGGGQSIEEVIGKEGGREIYGEASLAQLGDEQIDISLLTSSMELNTRNIFDPENRKFEDVRLFPEDIFTQESEVSEEGQVSQEYLELVRNYFLKTALNPR